MVVTILSGPTQALLAYTGFILVPLGHGTVIQPATAALMGIVLAAVALSERVSGPRILGCIAITAGLVVFGIESLMTIGVHGIGGDLLFFAAGAFWACFWRPVAALEHLRYARGRRRRRYLGADICAAPCRPNRL